MESNVLFGAGILLLEPLRVALLESLLPNGTSQFGPPACMNEKKYARVLFILKEVL